MADEPTKDKGKCISCGFLSKRSRTGFGNPSPSYYEASDEERHATPLFFKRWEHRGQSVSTDFVCFRGCADLPKEYLRDPGETARTTNAMLALERDRKCPCWYPYKPGFSPVRHYEWYQDQKREEDRRAFEERLSQRAEDLHKSLALRDEELQLQRDKTDSATTTLMKRLTVLALILAAVQVLTLTRDSLLAKAVVWIWRRIVG
jgi:hypothetical protein